MATTYDASTFEMAVLPNGLHKHAKDLVQGSIAVGWKAMVKGMTVRLISPDGQHTIMLSASNSNIPYQRHKQTILKHANPLLIPKDDAAVHDHARNIINAERITTSTREQREAEDRREIERRKAARKAEKVSAQKLSDEEFQRGVLNTEPPVEAEAEMPTFAEYADAPAERYVVSEHPMMAHAGQRKGYVSPTTNERKWSDGSIDYTCRSAGCDFARDDRHSVGRHWRKHVTAGEEQATEQPRETYVTPPHEPLYQSGYTPRRDRVAALAAVIAALDTSKMTAEEIAEFVLDWQHQQSTTGSRMAAEREEMTSDDVLNRIRSLLDNGTYLKQQEEIDNLRQETRALSESLAAQESRAQQAEERWTTLRELIAMDESVSA